MKQLKDFRSYLPECRTELMCGGGLILAGLILRLRQLCCFEFKDDQARLVINGLCALRDMFLVFAGQPGSSGIPNPAGGTILAGVIALFGTDAVVFAAGFALLSCLTVFGVWWVLLDILGRRRAWWCAVLTAVSPVLVWNASNLWGPGLLIFLVAWFIRGCVLHVEDPDAKWALVQAGLAAALGAWLFHLSCLFLFPGMVYAMIRRRPEWKSLAALAGIGLVLFSPWLYVLLFQWDGKTMPMVFPWSEKICAWFSNLACFANGAFYLDYFPFAEWPVPILLAAGLTVILTAVLFAAGAARWRRAGEADRIALLLTVSIPVLYLVLGLRLYPHYLMVILLPCILLASGCLELPSRKWAWKTIVLTGILMLGITVFWQNRVIAGNGHWLEFGPSGNYMESIAAELDGPTVWSLQVFAADEKAKKKLDPISTMYILDGHMQETARPNTLVLEWDGRNQRFTHRFSVPVR